MTEHANQNFELAKQHATTVTAALNAVNAYAEWAPVPDLARFGLIHGYKTALNAMNAEIYFLVLFCLTHLTHFGV
jgi:exportin-5